MEISGLHISMRYLLLCTSGACRQGEAPSHTLCLWQYFLFITRCLSLELLTTKHLSLWNISHIIHIFVILKLHTHSKCLSIMILILQYYNIYSKIFVNLHLLLNSPARVIADIFYVSFSSVSPFPVVKRSGWPAGKRENYRFRHCNFAT